MELIPTVVLAVTAVFTPSGVELERLADNLVHPPGIVVAFNISEGRPVPCGDVVLFEGTGDGKLGAYLASSAGLRVIANVGTPVPGSTETFQEAWQLDCAGGRIVFLGDGDTSPLSSGRSVYSWTDGDIALIIKEGILIGDDVVQSFNQLSGNEFGVAMKVALVPPSIALGLVIKPFDGEPFIVADQTTVLPGQTVPAESYSDPVLVGPDLVFLARTLGNIGIYRWAAGQGISIVVDTQTPVPVPGGGNFGTFFRIASLDYGIVFDAAYSGGFGLFVARGGQLRPLIVPGDTTKNGEVITSAFFPSGAGSLLSFNGRTADNLSEAVFVRTPDGKVRRILGVGDTIEGILVDRIISGTDSTNVAIRVRSSDLATQVIYRARFASTVDVPALSKLGIAVLFLGLALIGLWVLHGRRKAPGASQ